MFSKHSQQELHTKYHLKEQYRQLIIPLFLRIPEFYTLTKIHKPKPVGGPIVSGCEGPTVRISSFVDNLLQPIAKAQTSYLKDTTDFINFVEKTNKEEFSNYRPISVLPCFSKILEKVIYKRKLKRASQPISNISRQGLKIRFLSYLKHCWAKVW